MNGTATESLKASADSPALEFVEPRRSEPPALRVLEKPLPSVTHSTQIASILVMLTDAMIFLGAGAAILWYLMGGSAFSDWVNVVSLVVPSLAVVAAFYEKELYSFNSICNPVGQIQAILKVVTLAFLSFLALAFAFKVSDDLSRVWVFSWYGAAVFLILIERSLCRVLFFNWAKEGLFSRKIAVVGCGPQAQRFLEEIQSRREPWIRVVGVFDDRKKRFGPSFMGFPVLGSLKDLLEYARNHRVDDIVVNLPWNAEGRIIEIIRQLEELPVHVRLGSDLAGFVRLRTSYSTMGGIPMLDVAHKPLDGWGHFLKLVEDRVLGFLLLALLSPVMALIALAIKLESPGPVFFLQNRHGFNNKRFRVFKFRSMYHGRPPEKGVPQAVKGDPRVTRIGAFLRRTSLDELPQLLNVLNGTMSLVGPRPHAIEHNEEYSKVIDGYFARHRVKPGITGWAQVNGLRGETDTLDKMKARVEHDIHYIENWSLFFDFRILFMTALVVAGQKNAY